MSTLSERIAKKRQELGLSQPDLADLCGWGRSQSRISQYETGKRTTRVNLGDLAKIAKALKVDVAWLAFGVTQNKPALLDKDALRMAIVSLEEIDGFKNAPPQTKANCIAWMYLEALEGREMPPENVVGIFKFASSQ